MKNFNTKQQKNVLSLKCTVLLMTVLFAFNANAQNVVIPDPNFKNALLNHDPVIDTNGDGNIQYSEAGAFTGTINVSDKGLDNSLKLIGLEAFINITGLDISHNDMAPVGGGSINFNHYTALTSIKCNSNQFETIDVSELSNLEFLHCSDNNLTGLNLTGATKLETLWASNNQLTTIDVSDSRPSLVSLSVQNNNLTGYFSLIVFPELKYVQCFDNNLDYIYVVGCSSLIQLEVYNNPSLWALICEENAIESLNLSGLPALTDFSCRDNQLTNLDISGLSALELMDCSLNQITSLDVSANPDLTTLYCDSNQLTNLNVANGNNVNFTTFWAENNDLDCIQIDSGFTPPTDGTWTKDPEAGYSDNCAMSVSDAEKFTFSIYPNPINDILTIDSQKAVEKIEVYDLSGKKMMEVTGQKQVNMSSLASGTYMVKIMLDGATETQKVIKK